MARALLTCVSHGPALTAPAPEPPEHKPLMAAYAARAEAFRAFDPELVILFAPDHYTGVHLQMVPPFAVGLAAEAVADFGGRPGRLRVPAELGLRLAEAVRAADIDIAVGYDLTVDHGFSQPLYGLAGALDRYPTLPVFINTTCAPVSAFRRVRLLGEAVGRFAHTLGLRVALVASGGLSHHPVNVFPPTPNDIVPGLEDYLVFGGAKGGMDRDAWIAHLGRGVVAGGQAVVRGEKTAKDFRLNPAWDRGFLDAFLAGDYPAFDAWDPQAVIEQAGVGAIEVQQWIAAGSAAAAFGLVSSQLDFYYSGAEYRISVCVAHAGPSS